MATRSRPNPKAAAPDVAQGGEGGEERHARAVVERRRRAAARSPTSRSAREGEQDRLLQGAAEEAARLLDADGAFLYLLDPETGVLQFTHSAGIVDLRARPLDPRAARCRSARACSARPWPSAGSSSPRTTPTTARSATRRARPVRRRGRAPIARRRAAASPATEVFGALGTFSRRPDAFTAPQIALVRSLAEHAAFAMANARLIAELDRSRQAGERQALVERSLRELGTRISGARDPEAVVQFTIDEALRLLDGDGARIDIVDPEARLLQRHVLVGRRGDPRDRVAARPERLARGRAPPAGRSRPARRTSRATTSRTRTSSTAPGRTRTCKSKGIHGVIATPLHGDQGPFGAITVWSTRVDAFGPDDAALLETIAGQSAVALGRARLIEELGRSREALARRAEEERTLREIGGRLATIGSDPGDLLLRIVHEAARLLGAERARLDLVEPRPGRGDLDLPGGQPVHRRAGPRHARPTRSRSAWPGSPSARAGPVATGDYMADRRFKHYTEGDEGVQEVDLHSVITAPVVGEDGLVGVFQAGPPRPRRVRRGRAAAARRAGRPGGGRARQRPPRRPPRDVAGAPWSGPRTAERALREIARRLMTIQDPAELLQDVVDEAARLLGSSGAVIDLLDPATGEVHWAHDAGIDDDDARGVAGARRRRIGRPPRDPRAARRSSPTSTPPTSASPTARRTATSSSGPGSGRSRSRRSSARPWSSGTLAVFSSEVGPVRRRRRPRSSRPSRTSRPSPSTTRS